MEEVVRGEPRTERRHRLWLQGVVRRRLNPRSSWSGAPSVYLSPVFIFLLFHKLFFYT
jgi:hypothetical protein